MNVYHRPQRDALIALWFVLGPNFCRIREEYFAGGEVVSVFVEFEVAVPHLRPA